jgi:hypothetical protein
MSRASRVLPTPMAGARAKTISVGLAIVAGQPLRVGAQAPAGEQPGVAQRAAGVAVAAVAVGAGDRVGGDGREARGPSRRTMSTSSIRLQAG